MLRHAVVALAGLALLVGTAGHADAAKRKARAPNTITISGCPYWAPPACTNMWSGGQAYTLIGGSVPLNVGVTVVGVKSGDVSICFATPVKVLRWKRNKMRCPLM